MKLLVLAIFVAAVAAAPLDDSNGPVELIVNGVADEQPLEIGHIVDIKLQEHSAGEVSATDLLHPFTAVGIAEAAAAAIPAPVVLPAPAQPEISVPAPIILPAPAQPEVSIPAPVVLPAPAQPEFYYPESDALPSPALPEIAVPAPIVLPAPAQPEVAIPAPVVLPAPAQPEIAIPAPVVLPAPAQPEVFPQPIVVPTPVEIAEPIPAPAAQLPIGDIYNDGNVQVTVNAQEPGVISTIQGWFNMVLNYFNSDGVQTTQQIV